LEPDNHVDIIRLDYLPTHICVINERLLDQLITQKHFYNVFLLVDSQEFVLFYREFSRNFLQYFGLFRQRAFFHFAGNSNNFCIHWVLESQLEAEVGTFFFAPVCALFRGHYLTRLDSDEDESGLGLLFEEILREKLYRRMDGHFHLK